jgi:hypothetical protein
LVRRLENPELRHSSVSATFHGRDILAPCAAHLSRGMDVRELGSELGPADMTLLTDLRAKRSAKGGITGRIIHIDRFGNLVTNIDAALLGSSGAFAHGHPAAIRLAGQAIVGLCRTYADGEAGRPLALVGSRGYLEIAVTAGSAQRHFGVGKGDAVEVRPAG